MTERILYVYIRLESIIVSLRTSRFAGQRAWVAMFLYDFDDFLKPYEERDRKRVRKMLLQ